MATISPQALDQEIEMIRRCQRGERDTFAYFVNRYQQWIYRQLFFWVGEATLAEEMAQEVFIKAYTELKNFRGEAKFSTWLFQIALNHYRDHRRSKERHRDKQKSLQEISEPPALSPEAEARATYREEVNRLRRALEALPKIYQEALTLRFLNERSYLEIAELLGEGISNVKMRVIRGLELLRTKLKETHND